MLVSRAASDYKLAASLFKSRALDETEMQRLQRNMENIGAILYFRQEIYEKCPIPLYRCMGLTHQFCATDTRDKIFALLSLASDASRFSAPDCSATVESVFLSTAQVMIRSPASPLILYFSGWGIDGWDAADYSFQLPSWVPTRWDATALSHRLGLPNLMETDIET